MDSSGFQPSGDSGLPADYYNLPNAADFTNAPTDFTQPGSFTPNVPAPSPDPLPADSPTYSGGGGSENLEYNTVPAAAPAPAGQDYSQFGAPQAAPQAAPQSPQVPQGFGQDLPIFNQTTGAPMTGAQVASANPQLYPGGVLPTDNQETVYTPTGDAYYRDATPIPTASGATTKDGKPTDYSGLLSQLLRLGLGAGTAYGLTRGVAQPAAKTAADQAQQAKNDRLAIATPYQNIGKGLINQAQAGDLSASNIQAVKAARAMAAQNISRTGGVGVLQGANSIADLEARLLDNQLTQGIQIANIGDNYAIGAIQAGQAADTALAQSQANFANQLATMLAPMVLGYAPQLGAQAIKSGGNLFSNPSLTTTDTSTPASPTSGEISV